jgi:hypothetical protein
MKTPLTYQDGTKSKLTDVVQVVTPRGETCFGVIVEHGEGGVWVVPVPRSSAIFVATAKSAAQANTEAAAAAEVEAEENAARLKAIADAAKAEADAAAALVA